MPTTIALTVKNPFDGRMILLEKEIEDLKHKPKPEDVFQDPLWQDGGIKVYVTQVNDFAVFLTICNNTPTEKIKHILRESCAHGWRNIPSKAEAMSNI